MARFVMYVCPNLLVASDGLIELLKFGQISWVSGYGLRHLAGCGYVFENHMRSTREEIPKQ